MEINEQTLTALCKATELIEQILIDGKREESSLTGYALLEARFSILFNQEERRQLLDAILYTNKYLHGDKKYINPRVYEMLKDDNIKRTAIPIM